MTRLNDIWARLEAATPGPWFMVCTDDDSYMSARYVGTVDRGDRHDAQTGMDGSRAGEIVAVTLYQLHPGIAHDAGRWDEDADLIANAPSDLRHLLERVELLETVTHLDTGFGNFCNTAGPAVDDIDAANCPDCLRIALGGERARVERLERVLEASRHVASGDLPMLHLLSSLDDYDTEAALAGGEG